LASVSNGRNVATIVLPVDKELELFAQMSINLCCQIPAIFKLSATLIKSAIPRISNNLELSATPFLQDINKEIKPLDLRDETSLSYPGIIVNHL